MPRQFCWRPRLVLHCGLAVLLLQLCACGSSSSPDDAVAVIAAATCDGTPHASVMPSVPDYPTQPVGRKYSAYGPCTVTAKPAFACCDSSGNSFDIWYPANPAAGARFPVVSWGDGTAAAPGQYAYLLDHLASWGFIVIASESQATHTGREIIDAAKYVVGEDSDPASPLHQRVQAGEVGAMGHSQGAGGVTLALMQSGGFIKTAVPIEKPAQDLCNPASDCPGLAELSGGSIFFVNGSKDGISPSQQAGSCEAGEQSNFCFYQDTPGALDKAWGTIIGPDHNDVQGQPDCGSIQDGLGSVGAELTCTYGVYGYLGYPTAWLVAQLQHDAAARAAFLPGGDFSRESNWSNQASDLR